jgi:hypothetical protein
VGKVLNDLKVEDNGENVTIHMTDLFAEETRNLVFRIDIPARSNYLPRPVTVGSLEVTWENTVTGDLKSTKVPVKVHLEKTQSATPNQDVVDQVAILNLYEANVKAMQQAAAGNINVAQSIMRGVSVSGASAGVASYASNLGACYVSNDMFNASSMNLASTNNAVQTGRAIGSSLFATASNSAQNFMVNSFTDQDPGIQGVSGTTQVGQGAQSQAGNQGIQGLGGILGQLGNSSGLLTVNNSQGAAGQISIDASQQSLITENLANLHVSGAFPTSGAVYLTTVNSADLPPPIIAPGVIVEQKAKKGKKA